MLTQIMIDLFILQAGPDFTWATVKSSRPHIDIRTALKKYLWDYANGRCVFCDEPISFERSQACHIVSSGGPSVRRGYVAGNIANGCGDCNDDHGTRFEVVPMSEIARPDLVPSVWPAYKDLRVIGRAMREARQARRSA
jgi:hypothetical protein